MEYFVVPVNNGVLDINYQDLWQGVQLTETECYVALKDGVDKRETWQPITEEQFNAAKNSLMNPQANPPE